MYRYPLLALLVVLALCVALALALPAGVDALKNFLSPPEPDDQSGEVDSTSPVSNPPEVTRPTPNSPDFPSN